MAGIETSRITTSGSNDLTIQPAAGKKTLVKSVDSTNPGMTPLATAADGELRRLDINALPALSEAELADNDLIMVQDVSDGGAIKTIKKTEVRNVKSGVPQPPFGDPLPTDGLWVDKKSTLAVREGGSGSTADLRNAVEFATTGPFNQSDKLVEVGTNVSVRWVASKLNSAAQGQTISGTLYAKTGSSFSQTWNLTINKQPTAGWDLIDVADQPVSTQITSAASVPTGMNVASPVTIDGGTLSGIQVSVNGGPFTASPGNILSGQPISVRGTTGPDHVTPYTALVSIGGIQRTWTVTTAVPSAPPFPTPAITSPSNGATDLAPSITAVSTAYTGPGFHATSDWELESGGSIVQSSMASASNLTTWALSGLTNDTTYSVRVKHRSSDGSESPWSPSSTFTIGPPGALKPGTPMEGGYLVGPYSMTEDGVATHNLIVGSMSSGSVKKKMRAQNELRAPGPSWHKDPDIGMNTHHGYPVTKRGGENPDYGGIDEPYWGFRWFAINPDGPNKGHIEDELTTGDGLGGYNDWYAGSTYEQLTCYFFLKPTDAPHNDNSGSQNNHLGSVPFGQNPNAVLPYDPDGWSKSNPIQVEDPAFQGYGAQSFDLIWDGGEKAQYYIANLNSHGSMSAWKFYYADADMRYDYPSWAKYWRALRRVPV